MDVSVRVPAGLEAISVGRLESRDRAGEADFDTWHWVSQQPMASYLNFVSIGQYELEEGVIDGRPYVYAVTEQLDEDDRAGSVHGPARVRGGCPGPGAVVRPVPVHRDRRSRAGARVRLRRTRDPDPTDLRPGLHSQSGFAQDLLVHELGPHVVRRPGHAEAVERHLHQRGATPSWAQWGYAEGMPGRRSGNATAQRVSTSGRPTRPSSGGSP